MVKVSQKDSLALRRPSLEIELLLKDVEGSGYTVDGQPFADAKLVRYARAA